MQSTVKSNPYYFWKFIPNTNNTTRIPETMKIGDEKLGNPQDIVASFAHFLSSPYTYSSFDSQNYTSNRNFASVDFTP